MAIKYGISKLLHNFSNRIKELLEERNLFASELGKLSGINPANIYVWLNEKNYPSLKYLTKFADYFNYSADYLFKLTEHKEFQKSATPIKPIERINLLIATNSKYMKTVRACDMPQSSFFFWRKGMTPNVESLLRLAVYFDVSFEYIIGRTDDKWL